MPDNDRYSLRTQNDADTEINPSPKLRHAQKWKPAQGPVMPKTGPSIASVGGSPGL